MPQFCPAIDTGVLIAFDCFLPHLTTIDHTSLTNGNFSFKNGVMRIGVLVAGLPREAEKQARRGPASAQRLTRRVNPCRPSAPNYHPIPPAPAQAGLL
jgi:hypothetical protein